MHDIKFCEVGDYILFKYHSTFSGYSLFSFTVFLDLEKIIFENFNISENNIISVELAKVLR